MCIKKACGARPPLHDVFINNLKYYRSQKKLSQEALSTALNKSSTYINGIENKGSIPRLEVIDEIARILDIEAYQLFIPFGSPRNITEFDRTKFMDDLTDKLHQRLKDDIRWEVQDVLNKDL